MFHGRRNVLVRNEKALLGLSMWRLLGTGLATMATFMVGAGPLPAPLAFGAALLAGVATLTLTAPVDGQPLAALLLQSGRGLLVVAALRGADAPWGALMGLAGIRAEEGLLDAGTAFGAAPDAEPPDLLGESTVAYAGGYREARRGAQGLRRARVPAARREPHV